MVGWSVHLTKRFSCGRVVLTISEVKPFLAGHKNILRNVLADNQAKAGAEEMVSAKDPVVMTMDKREAVAEIKRQIGEKWKLKFENS